MKTFIVYILRCSDHSYYTGLTSNLEKRLLQHKVGYFRDSYTYKRRPLELVYYCEFTEVGLAIKTEKQIKSWSKAKKQALIDGKYGKLKNLAKKKFRA